jgi:hypothetical protein
MNAGLLALAALPFAPRFVIAPVNVYEPSLLLSFESE